MIYDDFDVEKLTWQMFERTGNISYYLLHKSIIEDKQKEEKEKRR
ncbi:MAG: YqzL family protein [Clostridia bacterium]|nr:YqzL family protein [Clostridia bacterium]